MNGVYFNLPSGNGTWFVESGLTPGQAYLKVCQQAGVRALPAIKEELKELFPDDGAVDQIPTLDQ